MTRSDLVAGAGLVFLGALAIAARSEGTIERTVPAERTRTPRSKASEADAHERIQALSAQSADDALAALALTKTDGPRATAASRVVPAPRGGATSGLEGGAPVEADGLRLTTSFTSVGATLVLRYRVSNLSRTDAYLFTPLRRYDFTAQRWESDPARVYGRRRAGRTVELSKRLVALKRGSLPYDREVPRLTRLAPGEALEETIRLPLPLDLRGPRKTERGPATAAGVRFALGYLTTAPESLRREGDELTVGFADGLAEQRILTGPVTALELPVR